MASAPNPKPFPIAEVKPINSRRRQRRNREIIPTSNMLNIQDETSRFEALNGENTLNETNLASSLMSNVGNNDLHTHSSVLTQSIYSPSSNDNWISLLHGPTGDVCTSITSQPHHYTNQTTLPFPVSNLENNCITTRVFANRQNVRNEPLIQLGNNPNTLSWNSASSHEHFSANPSLNRKHSDLRLEDLNH